MAGLLITMGLPNSGKSRFLEKVRIPQIRIFSPDQELYTTQGIYDASPGRVAQAWRTEYRRFGKALVLMAHMDRRYFLAWDSTMTIPIHRACIVNTAAGAGLEVHGIFFDVSFETCMDRNMKRPAHRRVSEERMRAFARQLREPQMHEGFDSLLRVTEDNFDEQVEKCRSLQQVETAVPE